jgi:MFS family permease
MAGGEERVSRAAWITLVGMTLALSMILVTGRAFDRMGGRVPLTIGFGVLALSGVALAIGAAGRDAVSLIPGLALQGIGLGIVLTTNDPTGLTAVPKKDRGEAAGMINTTEQFGGALGIAALTALEVGYFRDTMYDKLAAQGIDPTPEQAEKFKDFVLQAEQTGLEHAEKSRLIQFGLEDLISSHVASFQLTFYVSAAIAVLGAVICFILVRRGDRVAEGPIFSRRSRWAYVTTGHGPGITRQSRDVVAHHSPRRRTQHG